MVCLLAAPWVLLSVSAGNGWPHNALWHHWLTPISCHFRDCKALLVTSLTYVSGAIASVQTFTCNKRTYGKKAWLAYDCNSRHSAVFNEKQSTVQRRLHGRSAVKTKARRCHGSLIANRQKSKLSDTQPWLYRQRLVTNWYSRRCFRVISILSSRRVCCQ